MHSLSVVDLTIPALGVGGSAQSLHLFSTLSVVTLVSGVCLTISSWLGVWVCIEVLLMVFCVTHTHGSSASHSLIKYFVVQSVSSIVLLLSVVSPLSLTWLVELSLCLKLGLVPFLVWVPSVYSGLAFSGIFLASTFLNVPAFILIAPLSGSCVLSYLSITSVAASALLALSSWDLNVLLGWSSVGQTGWLSLVSCMEGPWVIYLFLYTTLLGPLLTQLHVSHIISPTQIHTLRPFALVVFSVGVLSIAGLPPFSGFILKVLGLNAVAQWHILPVILVTISLVMVVYLYLKTLLKIWLSMSRSVSNSFTRWSVSLSLILPHLLGLWLVL